jgi:hypothetical protein
MKKFNKLLFLFLFYLITQGTSYSATDYSWITITSGEEIALSDKLVVRDKIPSENTRSRAIATIPENTIIGLLDVNGEWTYVTWYSPTIKTHKFGYASTLNVQNLKGANPEETISHYHTITKELSDAT